MFSSLKNRKGMTLIEIMIVLAIIGAMMALLAPKILGQQDKAKVKEAKILLGQIVNSLAMYYTDCGKYPQSLENLVTQDASCSNWGPEAYLKKLPKDPWGHELAYELNGNEYTLKCFGRDGKEGGSGYDADLTPEE
jgi:general secretion pathway protein G